MGDRANRGQRRAHPSYCAPATPYVKRRLAACSGHPLKKALEVVIVETECKKETSRGVADKSNSTNFKLESVNGPASHYALGFKLGVASFFPDMCLQDKLLERACELTPNNGFSLDRPNHDVRSKGGGNSSGRGEDEVIVQVDCNLPVRSPRKTADTFGSAAL
jgi:hypothetical protein